MAKSLPNLLSKSRFTETRPDATFDGFGGGNAISTAVQCGAKGMQVALVEKGPLGGTCPHRGCIPSKLLIGEPIDCGPMPHAIFTSPEIPGVGATEEELKKRTKLYLAASVPLANFSIAQRRFVG